MKNKHLDALLVEHIAAWRRSTRADDYIQRVNATYDAYVDGGGNETHYQARWLRLSKAYVRLCRMRAIV